VRKEPLLRVRGVEEARFSTAGLEKATVLTFQLPKEQAKEFRDITALNVGREMAMLVDGDLFFPPRQIASGMEGGRVQVQGYFYNPPLRKLIAVLSAGPLPGRLEEVSQGIP
jgi:preprotein translocase subunit SecD